MNTYQKTMKAYRFSKDFMHQHTDRPYHNFGHARDVTHIANKLAKLEGFSLNNRYLLTTAALMHDLIVIPGGKYNEEISAGIAEKVLPNFDYTKAEISTITKLIRATKLPTKPQTELEEIICDADIDNLGRKDFFERGDEVRREVGARKIGWYKGLLGFVKTQGYYTKAAQQLRNKGLQANIRELEKLVEAA